MTADVLVIGGGPAGSAAALRLARTGCRVVLVERSEGPVDKVCGEFVSGDAAKELVALGLPPRSLGAVPVRAMALADRRGRHRPLPLPFPAYSLTRRVLDAALLEAAARAGATVATGTAVVGLERDERGWVARTAGGGRHAGSALFLATGKHDLRGRPRPPGTHPGLVGLKMHYATAAPIPDLVALAPFEGGYAGLQPIADRRFNLCLAVEARRLRESRGGPVGLIRTIAAEQPLIGAWLRAAEPLMPNLLAIGRVPYGFVRTSSDGPFHLGDQAAVIPSLSGDGIAIALASAREAVAAYLAGETADRFQARFADRVRRPVERATLLSRLIVRPAAQDPIAALARLPGLAALFARATRIDPI